MPSDRKKKAAAAPKGFKAKAAASSKAKPEEEAAAAAAAAEDADDGAGSGSGSDGGGAGGTADTTPLQGANVSTVNLPGLTKALKGVDLQDSGRSVTGVLAGHPQSRDVHVTSFTLLYHGHDLLVDAELQLNYGRQVARPEGASAWGKGVPGRGGVDAP